MDVRQYAFLARQPAAAVKTRESFLGMPKRGLAFLLANVMFWQPMWAQADGIVVANPNTSLDRAGNGVPIINIATPNASGLSHNQFHDYNVGAQGLILNNGSTQNNLTQLGGHIIDNPNLKNSGSAQAILNEVISGNPSQLRGYTEVAGQSARVIVANPYGITCNGCGFINSPRVTLTTGKPVLDNGRLDRFQVDQGSVAIEGAGLNATNVDRFEIITRSAKINAEIQAQNLTIVAGRNDVNAQTLNATARADDGSGKPQLAIDSSALGGMYAGAIKLVGTEAGVGVKLDGKLIASGGDIQIDANGQLSLARHLGHWRGQRQSRQPRCTRPGLRRHRAQCADPRQPDQPPDPRGSRQHQPQRRRRTDQRRHHRSRRQRRRQPQCQRRSEPHGAKCRQHRQKPHRQPQPDGQHRANPEQPGRHAQRPNRCDQRRYAG
jgi:filamentous hemagglutinin